MGYYTRFELEVISGNDYETDYEEAVIKQVDYNPLVEETKWYGCEVDMKEVSKQYPKVLFKLIGEGEDAGDLWEAYFKNGKMQMCKAEITFQEFDESKLS